MTTLAKNDRAVDRVKPGGRRQDYGIRGVSGLRLVVHPTGRKVWYSLYQLGSGTTRKRVWQEIGLYSDHEDGWTLDKAIAENKTIQAKVSTGVDPQAPTMFSELFQVWLDDHAKKQLKTWEDEERRYRLHLQ